MLLLCVIIIIIIIIIIINYYATICCIFQCFPKDKHFVYIFTFLHYQIFLHFPMIDFHRLRMPGYTTLPVLFHLGMFPPPEPQKGSL